MDTEDFIFYAQKATIWLSEKGINFVVQPWMIWAIFPTLVLIFGFFIPAIRHHVKNHKCATRADRKCTTITTGKVIRFDAVAHRKQDLNGRYNTYYINYAVVQFLDKYEFRVSESLTRNLEIGDEVELRYNPYNPEHAMAIDDIQEGLEDNGLKGILHVLSALLVFAAIVLTIMFITGFFS